MTSGMEKANRRLAHLENLIASPVEPEKNLGELRVGVDLGTANVVLTVIDSQGEPVAGALEKACVVKDGLVIDYLGAIKIVRELKAQIEDLLQTPLTKAAAAYPPGTTKNDARAIANVVEGAELTVTEMIDEPTAAAKILDIKDGAVVDVGGGTTGVSVLQRGQVIYTADEATGGVHMDLVLAGRYGIELPLARSLKENPARWSEIFPVILPVCEKMASIVRGHIKNFQVNTVYLVGGTSILPGFKEVLAKELNCEVIRPHNPLLATPLGIAYFCK
jgi:ethanolamine utilization protein EutJ